MAAECGPNTASMRSAQPGSPELATFAAACVPLQRAVLLHDTQRNTGTLSAC